MEVTYFYAGGHYVDAANLRARSGLCKSTLHRRLEALANHYPPILYGNRQLFPVRILEAFAPTAITMESQKDNATPPAKNDDNE